MALVAVILALIVVGALVAAAFHTALLEQRIGRHTLDATQAAEAAEAGVAEVVESWEANPALAALAVNATLALPRASYARGAAFEATVQRLTDALYLIQSTGIRTDADGNVLARRVVGNLVRVDGSTVAPLVQRGWVGLY